VSFLAFLIGNEHFSQIAVVRHLKTHHLFLTVFCNWLVSSHCWSEYSPTKQSRDLLFLENVFSPSSYSRRYQNLERPHLVKLLSTALVQPRKYLLSNLCIDRLTLNPCSASIQEAPCCWHCVPNNCEHRSIELSMFAWFPVVFTAYVFANNCHHVACLAVSDLHLRSIKMSLYFYFAMRVFKHKSATVLYYPLFCDVHERNKLNSSAKLR